ncbi:MAG: hypothetical protein MJK04_09020 [Psychrosphaera sp.]|nr:hypothetical protein [Psychrosphaera sp.]
MDVFVNPYTDFDFETARIAALGNEDRQHYEASLKEYRDLYSVVKTAEQEGFEKGKVQGIEQGLEQGHEKGGLEKANVIALNLLQGDKMTIEEIAQMTGLSVKQVIDLKSSLNDGDKDK